MPYRKVTMRSFREDDEGQLFAVAKLAFTEGDDRRTLATLARDTVFVAELAGEPAGYVAIEILMKLQRHGAEQTETLRAFTREEAEDIVKRL